MPAAPALAPGRPRPIDRAFVGVVAGLTAGSFAALLLPIPHAIVAPGLDICLDTLTTLVTLSVAVLSWIRYRERGQTVALFQAAAFAVLAIANLTALLLALAALQGTPGTADRQAALYIATVARLSAAGLLGIGGAAALAGRRPRRPRIVVLVPIATLLGFLGIVANVGPSLPSLTQPFASVAFPPAGGPAFPGPNGLGALLQVWCAALFLWAAAVTRRLYLRDGAIGDGYLAVGLVLAGFSQLQFGAASGAYPGLVGISDILRLAFDLVLLLGIEAEAQAAMDAMRRENSALERLRAVEADRAVLEERARVSRELHDGLAQDLWLAKLKTGHLERQADLAADTARLCREIDMAIDVALLEARQTVLALRTGETGEHGFVELVRRSVDEMGDRFGYRTELATDDERVELPAKVQAELLRVVQEALNNVGHHADATAIRVSLTAADRRLTLSIEDNGRGFDLRGVREGFGLRSMRERCESIGASLEFRSEPLDGTRVLIVLPLPPASATVPEPTTMAAASDVGGRATLAGVGGLTGPTATR